ncbi:helix-turn-helix transcriptional regulator [Stenotrophomonas sp.]|uniref:helix-turn-helix transcriptional regulator n=1 Tax=Stenotrophomonas sp. TaxID=69392 RepID=UPI003D0E99B8
MRTASALPDTGFLRLPDVLRLYPVSRSTWWAGVKAGRYPQPFKIGERATAWRAEDIRALISSASTNGAQP